MKLLIVLFLMCCTVEARTQQVRIATPLWEAFVNSDGSGIYMDILTAVYGEDYAIVIDYVPYKRAIKRVSTGDSDVVIGTYSTKYLSKHLNLITAKVAIDSETVVVVFNKKHQNLYHGVESLANKNVVSIRGFSYDRFIDIPMFYSEVNKPSQAWGMLFLNRIDFYIDNSSDVSSYINRKDIDRTTIVIRPIFHRDLFVAFKNNVKGRKLANHFDAMMPEIINSGLLAAIYKKYDQSYLTP